MQGFTEKLLEALIGVVLFFALIGVIVTSSNSSSFAWSAVNIGGTVTDLSWAPYVIVLVIVVATVILIYRHMSKGRK